MVQAAAHALEEDCGRDADDTLARWCAAQTEQETSPVQYFAHALVADRHRHWRCGAPPITGNSPPQRWIVGQHAG